MLSFFAPVCWCIVTLKGESCLTWQSGGKCPTFTIIIIISAVHATAGRWPPQLTPCTSILSQSHPLTATNFLDVVSPPPILLFSLLWVSIQIYLGPPGVAPSGYMSCPLSSHVLHSIVSFTYIWDLITSFRILYLFVMFNNDLSMFRWATASFSWCFVRVHVSAP